MSEQIPVNLLKEGKINDWNEWRSQHSDQHLDLTNTNLSSLDLTGANLSNSNLSGVDLTGTNLQDTDFTEVSNIKDIIIRNEKEDDFRNACRLLFETGQKFFSIRFDDGYYGDNSKLRLETIFYEHFNNYKQSIDYSKYDEFYGVYMVDLETASYFAVINWGEPYEDEYDGWSFKYTHTTAEYNGKNISDPLLERRYGGQGKYAPDMNEMEQYLIKIRVQEQDLSGKNFFNRDLSGQDFSHANLQDANLEGANLQDANLKGANLQDANLSRADLKYADLEGANLENANLENANLVATNLENANLKGINLVGADLDNTIFEKTNLENANLENANLEGANLKDANLKGANLQNAYLGGADFTGADLTNANLEGIVIEEDTKIEIPEK